MNLTDPYLKTARAKEHLENLRQSLDAFYKDKPCSFHSQDDVKHQRCRIRVEHKDAPHRISLIVGDIFYCLRASLDQLVWCLAKLQRAYPTNTQFPILETPNPERFQRRTAGVSAEALAIIESLQPYHGREPKSHLLWRLDKMCNIDKHMRIPMHGTVLEFTLPQSIVGLTRFENGGVMNIPLALKPAIKRHVTLNPDIPFEVVFGDTYWGIECNFTGIETIYNFVADSVIPRFTRFFK